jgi:benzodiazapine receptor
MLALVFIGLPLLGGAIIGKSIASDIKSWYPTIRKPSWTPPSSVFGPVWTVLYAMMGYAAYRVWMAGGGAVPLTLYAVQLALNFAWSPLFFRKRDLGAATVDILAMVGVVLAAILEFDKVDPLAARLMLPYLGWSCFAAALSYSIWQKNL